jgi:hypothetical protein
MPPKVVLSDVVAGGLVTPGPPETTVLLLLVGIRVALAAVVHQLAEALSAKVYVLVLTRSFDPNGGVNTVPQSFVLVEPVLPKSRRLGVPVGARSDTSRSLTHVCLALKLTSTDDTVPDNPDTVKVTSLGAPPGLPQVGVPDPSGNMPNVAESAANVAAGAVDATVGLSDLSAPASTLLFIVRPKQKATATKPKTITVYSKEPVEFLFSTRDIK